ncbi:MAG: formylglycine-generating enzyme family protein [Neomegalonema sp.]|nr:formylglycine-generating enzyme family protein [Neomegalonema sp.]
MAQPTHNAQRAEAAARKAEVERLLSTPLATFRDPFESGGEGPEMVVIPEGEFMMGSPVDEPGRRGDESPQHLVRIANRFALGKYAVTFDEFDAYCAATGVLKRWDEGWGRGRRPVIHVSCDEAQGYCTWLSEQSGAEYRLPSEAEWEYACRAGTETPFWWGSEITSDQANYNANFVYEGGGAKGVNRAKTVPVDLKEFKANPFGLHQMLGNVWEWCADAWNDNYQGAPDDGSAWMSGATYAAVLRGGAWNNYSVTLRSAARYQEARDRSYVSRGFRVARTIISP